MKSYARIAVLLIALAHATPAAAQPYRGRPLAEALQALQAQGLRIVFSSVTVPPDLRVATEPRAATARQQLDELLASHGLEVREGPGGTLQVVRAEPASKQSPPAVHGTIDGRVVDALTTAPLARVLVRVDGHPVETRTDADGRFVLKQVAEGTRILTASASGYLPSRRAVPVGGGTPVTLTLRLSPEPRKHSEYVSVTHPAPHRNDRGVAAEMSLDRSRFERLHGSLAEDPIRAVHAFPRVTAIDEFRSDFAVRGSPFRHVDLFVDGVSAQWLQHTAHGRGSTGSIPMVSAQVLENATLRTGAYPRRHGDRLGPELDLTLREGSRSDVALRGAIGGTHALLLAEGPIGAARGSWLIAARQSYLEWPPERSESTRTAFGFSDGLAKVVLDVRPTQQLSLTVLGGLSSIDGEDNVAPNEPSNGMNRASVFNLSWRSTFGKALVVRQRAYVVRQRFLNTDQGGRQIDRGGNHEVGYRADLTRAIAGGLLEAGAQVGQTTIADDPRPPEALIVRASSWLRSGFAHFTWAWTPSLTVSPGVRLTSSTLLRNPTLSRWLLVEWSFRPGWALTGSAGVSRQLPQPRHVLGEHGALDLRPERAKLFDLGIEWRSRRSVRWQASVFSRQEADILRDPDIHPRLVNGVVVVPDRERYTNALRGRSRGIELLVDRRSSIGLSGWVAYSYGRTRHSDALRGETYWGDFDQRHTFNLFSVYRFSAATTVGATFRAGTSFPIPGYLAEKDGRLFVAHARNQVRLPSYARLDLRADRRFEYFGRRLMLFVELLNALNRANVGLANGSIHPVTGEAIGFTDRLLPRSASAGVVIEF